MRFLDLLALALCTGVANAHFRLHYPEPRGQFVADKEPTFCGGYTEVTPNRTTFPLSGGFFTLKQGHPHWSGAVLLSTEANPNTFGAFNGTSGQQFARYWANGPDAGELCVPLDLSATNITGVKDGANVTIQIAVGGADGNLYQCADLTLSSNFTIPQALRDTCKNTTLVSTSGSSSGAMPAPSGSSGALSLTQPMFGYTATLTALGVLSLVTL